MRTSCRALALLALVGAFVAAGAVAWACTPRAWIEIEPSRGASGTEVQVTGGAFTEDEKVRIYWKTSSGQVLGEEMGPSFTTTVVIPEEPEGTTHTILATNEDYAARESFRVTAGEPDGEEGEEPSEQSAEDGERPGEGAGSTEASTSGETDGDGQRQAAGSAEASGSGERGELADTGQRGESREQDPSAESEQSEADHGQHAASGEPITAEDVESSQRSAEADSEADDTRGSPTSAEEEVAAPTPEEPEPSAAETQAEPSAEPAAATAGEEGAGQAKEQVKDDPGSGSHADAPREATLPEEPGATEARAGDRTKRSDTTVPDRSGQSDLWSGLDTGRGAAPAPSLGASLQPAEKAAVTGQLTAGMALLGAGMVLLAAAGLALSRQRPQAASRTGLPGRLRG